MRTPDRRWIPRLAVPAGLGGLAWLILAGIGGPASEGPGSRGPSDPVPVEVVPVARGPIELRRTFSGTLEAPAQIVVAPKIGGRVERMNVDMADPIERGQVVAVLDNDEYEQAVTQARAELAVARAMHVEAASSLEIAERELDRMQTLREKGVASESQLDVARADHLTRQAAVEVANANVTRAEAALESARIRLGYTTVSATWSGGDDHRIVAERFVDEGDTVSASSPLLSIVELDPILAVVFVTERDYGRLQIGQPVALTTDAFPGETFEGSVTRIAPVFRETSRQARVELSVANPEHRLKPGMFVRVVAILDRADDATIVPIESLTRRDGVDVVFVVDADGRHARLRAVEVGIEHGDRVQVTGTGIEGHVVTLGQQMLDDGSPISLPGAGGADPAAETDGS
jgi:RND family efflux transporter MFP subunit